MPKIQLIEFNHRISPLSIRESVSSRKEVIQFNLGLLTDWKAFVLGTCHRYCIVSFTKSTDVIVEFLENEIEGLERKHLLVLEGDEAVEHFFSTACGLNSRTLGEHEVLGQIRNAFEPSKKMGSELNELVKRAIYTGKRARTETSIGCFSTSLSAITADRINEHFNDLSNISVLLYGTGEMSRLILKRLENLNLKSIYVVSKDLDRAQEFCSKPNQIAITSEQCKARINEFQVVIGATTTDEFLISCSDIATDQQVRLFIDLGMPRNLDPCLGDNVNWVLYDLDTINGMAKESISKRKEEFNPVKTIIRQEVKDFAEWLNFRQHVPEIRVIKERLGALKQRKIDQLEAGGVLDPSEVRELSYEIQGMIQKHFSQIIAIFKIGFDRELTSRFRNEIMTSLYLSLDKVTRVKEEKMGFLL